MTLAKAEEPEVVRVVRQFRARLIAMDDAASLALIDTYGPIWLRMKGEIDSLIAEAAERQLSAGQLQRLSRLQRLQEQMAQEIGKFSGFAQGRISEAQRQAVALALQSAKKTVDLALPPGIDTKVLARVGVQWVNLPTEAFANFVGFSRDGAPLARLLDQIGPTVRQGVVDSIARGLAYGMSPRDTARLVQNSVGMGLTRALAISRTETMRSFREASRLQYYANRHIVKRFRRVSAKDDRVCIACIALDNAVYEVEQPLDAHVNCRCAIVPETIGYRDLGIPVDRRPFTRATAQDWFEAQPEETQRSMMGTARYEAWRDGLVQLTDMVKVESNPIWGEQAVTKPIKEMVL